ncbi:hypothetical protein EDD11_006861 [Mortierella claussenii]|nr:hypothetical protein EDD11_006861 [Mortierella claussenii]
MASILFDDINFPRELYDPDTLEFVPPVSTLLAFTPHILSQFAKASENEQEPMPIPTPLGSNAADSQTKEGGDKDTHKDGIKEENNRDTEASSSSSTSPSGLFSKFQQFASTHGTQKLVDSGLYLAGQYMNGAASGKASSSREREREQERDRYSNNNSSNSWDRSYQDRHQDREQKSSWFGGRRDHHQNQERERLREMEERLRQMEQDMRHNSAMARSEIDIQRRERHKLEQELEQQKIKVKKLEKEMEQREADEIKKKKEQEEEEAKKKKKEKEKAEQEKREKEKSKDKKGAEKEDEANKSLLKSSDAGMDPAHMALMASVGVASLVMSLYSAHKASATYSVVSFHDQLEQLMKHCENVVQSTEAWMSEQFLEVPDQMREDVKLIKELMDAIQRLDPRSEKKAETVAWSMSAVGSLSAVGGVVLGSMTAMASGGTIVVGCALYGIMARARYNGPEYKGARTMMEHKVAQVLRSLGVNPAGTIASASSTRGLTRSSLMHDARIDRLRIEFDKRDGHDLLDADEIDGMVVEDALRTSAFSAPFMSQRSTRASEREKERAAKLISISSSSSNTSAEDLRPTLKMKKEPKVAVAYTS